MLYRRTLAATYSPTGEPAVPLALKCFTAGFGMGPGGATLLWPPEEQGFWTRENRCFSGAHGHGLSVYIIDTSVDRIEWFLIERETSCILRYVEEIGS